MNSREKILERVKSNQPAKSHEAYLIVNQTRPDNPIEKFKNTLISIGGSVLEIERLSEIKQYVAHTFPLASQIATDLLKFDHVSNFNLTSEPHALSKIDIGILQGEFGVSENGAVWLTQKHMLDRALPFICENLILVVQRKNIIPTLHEAYDIIADSEYEYGTFIAGPSKTADIEQSLVLGAHGPKTLAVFIMN
jgi:L-lactate dehydrogenase complex protein LldG